MEKDNVKKELREIAPHLEKLSKENPFSVPENYFDAFPSEVQEKILKSRRKQTDPGFYGVPRLAFIGVTAVMLLVAGYFFLLKDTSQDLNGFADEAYFDPQLEWYAEYQSDVYYDIIFDDYEEPQEETMTQNSVEDQIEMDYLIDYSLYFMDRPFDDSSLDY